MYLGMKADHHILQVCLIYNFNDPCIYMQYDKFSLILWMKGIYLYFTNRKTAHKYRAFNASHLGSYFCIFRSEHFKL